MVNNDAASKASQKLASKALAQNHLTPGDVARGRQTGGVVPGVPKSVIGSWRQYDKLVNQGTQVASHFARGPGVTVGTPKVPSHFAPGPGNGTAVVTKAEKADLKWLEQVYGVGLPRAEKLASASGAALSTNWNSQGKSAANARARMSALTATLGLMHGGQKHAIADADAYTTALRLNGVASTQTISARREYIQDLQKAGIPARDAIRLANQLSTGINTLGNNLASTHPSRHQLVADLVASGVNAKTARGCCPRTPMP